ncbi:sugar ABC transporter permease [Schaalia sp. ZJ1691]|uniref:carbohydrate ABC transporter permease n=1 Tax=Schaalia sp. ZJ1691 TaxID=2709404 RepID=UPI0013EE3402|nr:sugar ABC transporter permease [Schaalia sp. ZJ1691]
MSYEPYVLLMPALVLVAVFAVYPLVRSIWFAFNDVSPFTGEQAFVGIQNFVDVMGAPQFWPTMARTAGWVFGAVTFQFIGGLLLALLLNTRFPLRGIYRGLVMVPWATPSVLVALMWKWILDPNNGVLNGFLQGIGVVDKPVEFLSSSATALPTLVMVDVWQGIPLFAVMILAALQSVSSELKEAASIDGCGRVGTFRHVVVPAILPTILITVVLRLIWTANYVDLIFILTGGGPGSASTTLALESYLTAYKATDFGHGATYAVIQAVILAVFIAIYLRLTKKVDEAT